MINQLFRVQPSKELVYRYCQLFGLSGMQDRKWFTREHINVDTLVASPVLDDLKDIYIKCKARSYLTEIDDRVAITVLRQLLKTYGYTLKTHTITRNGKRVKEYQLNRI